MTATDKVRKSRGPLVTKGEIEHARQKIAKYLAPTPLVRSYFLSALTGAEVFLKLESMQPTHSFKVRGAFNAILSLPEEALAKGVITASGGNHGLGVAYAAKSVGTAASVYLPVRTPHIKVEAIDQMGAATVMFGDAWDEANREALKVGEAKGLSYIHPFDDTHVMGGQGTIVLEILDQLGSPDLLIASIGGGGLISGIASALQHFSPETNLAGVETQGADCMRRSIDAGQIVELQAITSIADSLGAKRTSERQFQIVRDYVGQVAVVDDKSTVKALLRLLHEDKILTEPAAACCVAALLQNEIKVTPKSKVVVIICGANIAIDRLLSWSQEYSITFLR